MSDGEELDSATPRGAVPTSQLRDIAESWREAGDQSMRTDEAIRSAAFELCASRLENLARAYEPKGQTISAKDNSRNYQIRTIRSFDPSSKGLPPGDPVEAFEFAASHNGLSGETWELVDTETGEVVATYEL